MTSIFLILGIFVFQPNSASGTSQFPHIIMDYSFGMDAYCPQNINPEVLPEWATKLIPKIPLYRGELLKKVPYFQTEWNKVEASFLGTTVSEIGIPFQRKEFSVSLFLCPRTPSMGTPLIINALSYLESPISDIPTLDRPMPVFLFNSIVFHEILHKYVNDLLKNHPSEIIKNLPKEYLDDMSNPELVTAHLHLFALRKLVYEKLKISHLLNWVKVQEDGHGKEYSRAWEIVHEKGYADSLVDELKATARK